MTRDEAITNLNMISVAFVDVVTKEQRKLINDTFDMAIKALEQESCEDCISRKEDISELEYQLGTATDYKEALKEVLRKTKNTRSVRPKEKMGHWILTDVEGFKVWHCNCSECNKDPQRFVGGSENWWLIKSNLPKYCPNCGAKMKSEDEK